MNWIEQKIIKLEKMISRVYCKVKNLTNIHNNLEGLQGGQKGQYYHLTQDSTIELSNRENKIVSSTDLIYSDLNGDPITNVRFIGDTSKLFTDSGYTTQYVANTELPINFTLYFKAPDQDASATYQVQYNVKANGVWSS